MSDAAVVFRVIGALLPISEADMLLVCLQMQKAESAKEESLAETMQGWYDNTKQRQADIKLRLSSIEALSPLGEPEMPVNSSPRRSMQPLVSVYLLYTRSRQACQLNMSAFDCFKQHSLVCMHSILNKHFMILLYGLMTNLHMVMDVL